MHKDKKIRVFVCVCVHIKLQHLYTSNTNKGAFIAAAAEVHQATADAVQLSKRHVGISVKPASTEECAAYAGGGGKW